MSNLIVNCNNCGENIEIHDGLKFVTCGSCFYPLEIIRTGTSYYTQVKKTFDKVKDATVFQPYAPTLTVQQEIELLDKRWNEELPSFMENGALPKEKENTGNVIVGTILGGAGAVFFMVAVVNGTPHLFIICIFIIALGIILSGNTNKKFKNYQNAKELYETKRTKLIEKQNNNQ
jgi:hypothetical protein